MNKPPKIRLGWSAAIVLFVVWISSSLWLVTHLNTSDWVPIVVSGLGLLVALAVAVWNITEQRRLAQMNFAVTLWGQWSEESMLRARNLAWDTIVALPVEGGRKRVGELRYGGPDQEAQYRSVARINHVLADLNDFLGAGLLHPRDVSALFRDTLQAYYCHLMVVDLAQGMETRGGPEHQVWFESKVLGLADHLRLRHPKDYTRYGDTLTANLKASEPS